MRATRSAPIGRRRGTRGGTSGGGGGSHPRRRRRLLAVLAAAAAILAVLFAGLVLGARMALNDPSAPSFPGALEAEREIARLVAESARAEAALLGKRARGLGREVAGAAGRLRGAGAGAGAGAGNASANPAPGDAFYNPHHAIDDYAPGGDRTGGGGGGGGGKGYFAAAAADDDDDYADADAEGADGIVVDRCGEVGASTAHFPPPATDRPRPVSEDLDDPSLPDFPHLGPEVGTDHDFGAYVPGGGHRYPEYAPGASPYRVTEELRLRSDRVARTRRLHVRAAMRHAWGGYRCHAFGRDELQPVSGRGKDRWGAMGTTLVDSLDTLWLMGMRDEFWEARDWVRDQLDHDHVGTVSVFETTIRSLGGLLAAYDWSADPAFLDRAEDLGSRLAEAFSSPSGLPFGQVHLGKACCAHNPSWSKGPAILSEVGTLQLEFRSLARATGKPEYARRAERVFEVLDTIMPEDGLMPLRVQMNGIQTPIFSGREISLGAMGDSIYEYMLKIWLQGGRKEPMYRAMYDRSMQGVHDELLKRSSPAGLAYFADLKYGGIEPKMDHLACFMGGLLALGAHSDPLGMDGPRARRDLETAKAVTYTCYQMYARTEVGISSEYVEFVGGDDFKVPSRAPHYLLRPEAVESFFILHQVTGDPIYREWGWEVFQSIERYCRTKFGYGHLRDVRRPSAGPDDQMESFFLAETLKYLYLLFDPDSEVDVLSKHVFNTEAHPTRIFDS